VRGNDKHFVVAELSLLFNDVMIFNNG